MDYEERIVFFVDILGFRDLLRKRTSHEIGKVLKYVQEFYEDENSVDAATVKTISFFSDCIVISIKPQDKVEFDEFLQTMNDFQLLIANLVLKGVFLRGGIAVGDIFHDSNFVFGPAFVEAYEYETKHAIYPRIICAPSVMERWPSKTRLKAKDSEFEDVLTFDTDGMLFVDYFAKGFDAIGSLEEGIFYLDRLKEITDSNLADAVAGLRTDVAAKYLWVQAKLKEHFP